MISKHLKAKVKRLHDADLLPSGTNARQLGLHPITVERFLRQADAWCCGAAAGRRCPEDTI